jgi:hypothetical protein
MSEQTLTLLRYFPNADVIRSAVRSAMLVRYVPLPELTRSNFQPSRRASHGPAMAVDLAGRVQETAGAEGTLPAQMPAEI